MDKALATFSAGRVNLDTHVDWPDGTRVEVCLVDKQPDAAEPLDLTAAEQAAIEDDRRESKELQKESTRRSWEEMDGFFE